MKKRLAVLVATVALLLCMVLPAAAEDSFTITVKTESVAENEVLVTAIMSTSEKLMDGGLDLYYPLGKVELLVDADDYDEDDHSIFYFDELPNGTASDHPDKGIVRYAFYKTSAISAGDYVLFTARFRVIDPSDAENLEFRVVPDRLVAYDKNDPYGRVLVGEPRATTTAPETTTTAPGKPTGESTPWALMTVAAAAGVAVVLLSTKK